MENERIRVEGLKRHADDLEKLCKVSWDTSGCGLEVSFDHGVYKGMD
jgi:hypothetical protein